MAVASRTIVEFTGPVDIVNELGGYGSKDRYSFSTFELPKIAIYLEDDVDSQGEIGDTVKCCFEGKITGFLGSVKGLLFTVEDSNGSSHEVPWSDVVVVKKAENFETGEVYVSATGLKYLRQNKSGFPWFCLNSKIDHRETAPTRPMMKLVAEKK